MLPNNRSPNVNKSNSQIKNIGMQAGFGMGGAPPPKGSCQSPRAPKPREASLVQAAESNAPLPETTSPRLRVSISRLRNLSLAFKIKYHSVVVTLLQRAQACALLALVRHRMIVTLHPFIDNAHCWPPCRAPFWRPPRPGFCWKVYEFQKTVRGKLYESVFRVMDRSGQSINSTQNLLREYVYQSVIF